MNEDEYRDQAYEEMIIKEFTYIFARMKCLDGMDGYTLYRNLVRYYHEL